MANLRRTEAKKQKDEPVSIAPLTSTKYQAETLRSPFTTEEVTTKNKAIASNPLQSYPLSMLRFVGTLFYGTHVSAIMMTPDNKVYQVKQNDIVGDHDGIITNIQCTCIIDL